MLIWIILICVCLLLQTTVFSWLKVWGVKPDLILIVVVYAAFWKGSTRGGIVGFTGGIIEDIVSGGLVGPNAFGKLITGFLFGISRKRFYVYSLRLQIITAFLGTLLSQLIFFLLMQICGEERSLSSLRMLLPVAGYNAILAPFIFWCLRRIVKQRYDRTKPDQGF